MLDILAKKKELRCKKKLEGLLACAVRLCRTTGDGIKNKYFKKKSVAHRPAGSPHLRASQDLLPGAPTKKGATYQTYLEGGLIHTYLDYKTSRNTSSIGEPQQREFNR